MTRRVLGKLGAVPALTAFLAVTLGSSSAQAQAWLSDRRYQEGPGYRVGDLELHPGLAGEAGYDSNWFLRSHKGGPNVVNADPTNPVRDAAVFRVTPSLSLSTLGPQRSAGGGEAPKITFRTSVAGTVRAFLGGSEFDRQHNVSLNAGMRLGVLPGRPVGANFNAGYVRTIAPSTIADPNFAFNRNDLTGGGELVLQPGGGTLDWRFGYQLATTLFETSNGVPFTNLSHSIVERGRWRFRPRSALIHDASFTFRNYLNESRATNLVHDSTPLRARLGLTTFLTPRIAALVLAGWGSTFFQPGSDPTVQQFDSVIGQAQLTFYPTANAPAGPSEDVSLTLSSIALGFTRDFQASFLGDFYESNRGYAKISYFFAGRALISLDGGVGGIGYPRIFGNTAAGPQLLRDPFTDIRADATLFAEYRFLDSLGVNLTFQYAENISKAQIPVATDPNAPAGTPTPVFDMNWRRFQAFAGVRWFM